jgi:putative transposase
MQSRKPYPTDLHDTAWQILAPLIPAAKPGGRPEEYPKREMVNAILSVVRTGGAWRFVPNDLPPWGMVSHDFWCWRTDGPWKRSNDVLRGDLRFDSAKKVNGRQRPIFVDTLGLLLAVVVTAAKGQDRDGATLLWGILRHWFTRLRCLWAAGAYAGVLETWGMLLRRYRKGRLEIVKRSDTAKGFMVLPKRWSVERTFGWCGKSRRLSKDYE